MESTIHSGNDDHVILNEVVNCFHKTLKNSPKAISYLQMHGIDTCEVFEHFYLGFSNRTLGSLIPENNRKEGAALRGQLQRIGIIKPNGHELFRGSIVVPIIKGDVIKQIYGRKTSKHLRPGTPIHSYLPSKETGFFNEEALLTCDEVIFCSAIFDALTFWSAGFKNVVCRYGGKVEQLKTILETSSVKRALIAYPNNDINNVCSCELMDQLKVLGIDSYRIEFPIGMDANSYAIKHKPANQTLGDLIRKASWVKKGQNISSNIELKDAKEEIISDDVEIAKQDLPATVLPEPHDDIDVEVHEGEIIMKFEERQYRIRGLQNNLYYDQLKVNILVKKGSTMHVDVINLYKDSSRNNFIKQSSLELAEKEETIKYDLSQVLLKLEILQQQNIHKVLKPKLRDVEISKKDKIDALNLLQSPKLINRILEDYEQCGVVGERSNILISHIATLSRKQDKPLAVIIQSTSAAGKTALMDAVLAFVPEEDKFQYSAMTGQSLFYMGDVDCRHAILAINEEGGIAKAIYPLKIMQSDGKLTISSTGKDPDTGKHVAREYHVEGPVMIFTTTTSIDIDEELLNRCLVLTVDENREQTRAIQDLQRFEETLEGLMSTQQREDTLNLHQNAQRLLKPIKVVNPYAEQLTFLDDKTRTRRDHKKYLTLIRSITLLHQYQREVKTTYYKGKPLTYIEVTLDDIELANSLVNDILGRTLDDMPPQTQCLLNLINKMVNEECKSLGMDRSFYQFTRRDVRDYCGWGDTQLKVHLKRLETMEYLLIQSGGRGKQIVYELLYNSEGKDGQPFTMGLLDVETLREHKENPSEISQPQVGLKSPPRRHRKKHLSVSNNKVLGKSDESDDESSYSDEINHLASYHQSDVESFHGGKIL